MATTAQAIFFCVVLASCGADPGPLEIPAEMVAPEPGHEGPAPTTERGVLLAAAAERVGRLRANEKLSALVEVLVETGHIIIIEEQDPL